MLVLLLNGLGSMLTADVRLPAIVSDGMVLQRDVALKLWGWADPGEVVAVGFRTFQGQTVAGEDGCWTLVLPAQKAGGPDRMVIRGKQELTLEDILVGDVWLCSGQSNMTHTFVRWQEEYAGVIAASENSEIRQFQVPTTAVLEGPLEDNAGIVWVKADPQHLLDFTVVGYAFAKKLYDRYHVPQGLLMSCVGGTRIEAWTSEQGFAQFPEQLEILEHNKDTKWVESVTAAATQAIAAMEPKVETDKGLMGELTWYDTAYEPKNWKRIHLPGFWEDQGIRDLNGVVWYRREIEVPEAMTGGEARVKLGRIVDADELFVNGQSVGKTTYQYPQRRYLIPAGVLKAGKNIVVIRVSNFGGKGGFVPDKPYQIEANGHTVDLMGDWQYRVGEVYEPRAPMNRGISAQEQPASLYNGMVAPYVKYAIRGILWYQGESNAGDPGSYAKLLPNLIHDWRSHWGLGSIPFYIVQLPNYMDVNYLPEASNWAQMREVQRLTAASVANTGLAVTLGLGEWNDIHPGQKMKVGERLARQAMKGSYGETEDAIVASGPVLRSCSIDESRMIELKFDSVGGGLISSDGEALAHFAVAGADGVFRWVQAVIADRDTVIVDCSGIQEPGHLRYAWADNPDFANLANAEGLPASSFQVDF